MLADISCEKYCLCAFYPYLYPYPYFYLYIIIPQRVKTAW